ncbi:hypothetical protein MHW47_02375 [Streptomyces sp. OfavH-34-F]|nr:hypothetical protein [Streptomyces sp. OfavH-34-F]MCG7523298.1 hypothetical protein [Streptomyces sp. OfavH-34-F]
MHRLALLPRARLNSAGPFSGSPHIAQTSGLRFLDGRGVDFGLCAVTV